MEHLKKLFIALLSTMVAMFFIATLVYTCNYIWNYIAISKAETDATIARINASGKDLMPTHAEAFIDSLYNMDQLPTKVTKALDSLYYKDKAQREFIKRNFKKE